MPKDRSQWLADGVLRARTHLETGRYADAENELEALWADEELSQHSELQDVRLALGCQLLQARIELGETERCAALLGPVQALAGRAGDDRAVALLQRMAAAIDDLKRQDAQQRARLATRDRIHQTSVEEIRAKVGGRPQPLADALIKKANAACDLGQPGVAEPMAAEALDLALRHDLTREYVFAQIALSRARPEEARSHLLAAWERASRVDEHTLVSTIARACELAGVTLAVQVGPDLD